MILDSLINYLFQSRFFFFSIKTKNYKKVFLSRQWHALGREEQAKYYELARRERQLHMQLYPDWSSRANTNRTKKRKRKQDTNSDPGGTHMPHSTQSYNALKTLTTPPPLTSFIHCYHYTINYYITIATLHYYVACFPLFLGALGQIL